MSIKITYDKKSELLVSIADILNELELMTVYEFDDGDPIPSYDIESSAVKAIYNEIIKNANEVHVVRIT